VSDGNDVVFAQFIPNLMKGLPNLTDLMIAWARRRLASAPQLVELERKSGEHREDDEFMRTKGADER